MSDKLKGFMVGLVFCGILFGAAYCGGSEAITSLADVGEGVAQGAAARRGIRVQE